MFFSILSLSFSLFLNIGACYKIDSSCSAAGIEKDIRNAMTQAFEMVDSALAHLSQQPWDKPTTDYVRNLFTKDGRDPTKTNMEKVKHVLKQIGKTYRQELTGNVEVPRDDVVSIDLAVLS